MGRPYQQGDEPVKGYRLNRFLGKGGYGEVWQANGPGGTEVAFKIIPVKEKSAVVERAAIQLRSLEYIKKIRHPHLVPIVALWSCDERKSKAELRITEKDPPSPPGLRAHTLSEIRLIELPSTPEAIYLALGLAEKNLLDRFRECKEQGFSGIPAAELVGYIEDAARALDFLASPKHDLGRALESLPHGNIKPQNILIVGGAAQVTDFGLARILGPSLSIQTPAFTAPETLEEGICTAPSDQYSLAVTYHYLRSGLLPFSHNEMDVVLTEAREGHLNLSQLPANEQQIIRRATSRRPESRFAHCSDMARELRHVLERSDHSSDSGDSSTSDSFVIEPGKTIVPGHKLVRLIGRGAYGEVWEAQAPGRLPVALKIIKELDRAGGRGRQEFRALEIIQQVAHNGLMELRAYWVLDRYGRMIPDELRGQPRAPVPAHLIIATRLADRNMSQILESYREKGKPGIPPKELFGYLRQVALALDYLNSPIHKLGERLVSIQHRDVKPDNIMLANDAVKLTDFGLAKIMENQETTAEIRQDSIGFTFHYAAPEVLRGKVTRWSDQYSLAITYFQLRTGTLPYGLQISAYDQMMRQLEGQLDLAILPLAERRVVARAAHVIPEERYPTCGAFLEALASVVPNMGALLDYQLSEVSYQPSEIPALAVAREINGETDLNLIKPKGAISTIQVHKAISARPTMRIVLKANEIYPPSFEEVNSLNRATLAQHAHPESSILTKEAEAGGDGDFSNKQHLARYWPLLVMFLIGVGMAIIVHFALKWLDPKPPSQLNFQGARVKEQESRSDKERTEQVDKETSIRGDQAQVINSLPPAPLANNPTNLPAVAIPNDNRRTEPAPPLLIFGMNPQEAKFSEWLSGTVNRLISTCQSPAEFSNAYRGLETVPQPMVTAQLLVFRAECQLEGENKNIMLADFWLKQALGLEEPTAYARYVQARILQEAHRYDQAAGLIMEALKDDISLRGFRLKRALAILDEAASHVSGQQKEKLLQLRNEIGSRLPQ